MDKFRNILAKVILVVGILAALYVGGWLMFAKPIIVICAAVDAGTLTGVLVGRTILKCIFASVVGGIIASIAMIISAFIKYSK